MAVEGQAGNSELNKNDSADLTEQKDEEMKNALRRFRGTEANNIVETNKVQQRKS